MRIAGISVDPPSRGKGMVEKLALPFPLLSDPEGELAKRCDLWNADESVAVPAIVVVDRDGAIRYLYAGNDFADRPGDEEIFGVLEEIPDSGSSDGAGEPEIKASADEAESSTVRPEKPAMPLEQLVPYYRGIFFTTVALKKRLGEFEDGDALGEVDRYQKMTSGYANSIQETRKGKQGS